jgi:hypothetical protein
LLNLKQITRYGLLILLCISAIAILHVNEVKAASPQTLEIIDTIEHDKVPLSVAVNEVTNMVYVGVNGGIIVINGTTKQTLTILPFLTVQNQSGYPNWIVVDTKTNRIFAGGDFDYIHVFDGNTNTLISNWNNNVNLYADNSQIAFDFERDLIYVASPTTWVYTYDTITVYNATTLQYSKSINIPGSYGLSSLQAINVAIDTRLNKIYAAWTRNATLFSFDGFNYTNVLKTKEGAFSSLPDIFFNPLTNILYSTTSGTTAFNGSSLGLLSLPNIGTIKALDPNLPIIYALKNNSTNTGQNLNLADGFTHNILASVDLSGLGNKVALSSRTGEIYITQQSLNRTLVILDTTFLRGSITINGGVTYANSTDVTLTLTYSDAGSGISQVRYSNDGVWDAEVWESASASKAWALTSGDGNKTVYYQIKDNSGLTAIYSDTITLDATAPTGSIVIDSGDASTSSASVTLSLTYSDGGSGVSQVRYSNDSFTWSNWESAAATKSWTLSSSDGAKTVFYQIKDVAGLISNPYSGSITLDTTLPTGSITINSGAIYATSTSVTLTLTSSDDGSGISQVRYSNNGSTWSSWETASASKTWMLTSGDGNKNVYYQIKDNAGLLSSSFSDSIILDTTVPTGSITINNGDASTSSTSVTLSLTYEDAVSGASQARYSNDGVWDAEVWESASASKAWALTSGDGNKTVYYQVKDNAGLLSLTYSDTITLNTATSAQSSNGGTTTATVDSIKPTANAGSDLTVNEDTSMALDGSGSRDNVGIASYTWTFKDGTDKTLTGKKPSYTFNTPGVYNITLSVKDAAGNTATDLVTVTVLDVTQPVAEGGQDQNIQMGKAVRFDAGTSIDNVGVTTYEWDFGDGVKATDSNVTHTYANAGTYTVTLTTKDLAGNIAIDTVEVAVSGSEGFPIWIIGVAISFFVVGIVGAMYLFRNRRLKLISK